MEENQSQEEKTPALNLDSGTKKDYFTPISILLAAALISISMFYGGVNGPAKIQTVPSNDKLSSALEENVLPAKGITLPVRWGNLGVKMTGVGVIDKQKMETLYAGRGGLNPEDKKMLEDTDNGNIKINSRNSGFLLNLFWALGLGNKNEILDTGPMMTYSGASSPAEALAKAGNFASTGGWTLAEGNAMDHYSRHPFIILTPEQQKLVERISKNIYRPCCDNPTHFPDCNHGIAMLGLLELMASQGVSETEMYKTALQINSYWFPDTYLTIATYMKNKGVEWKDVSPPEMLGANYSSASGYARVASQVAKPEEQGGNGGCDVHSGEPKTPQRQPGGCGL